MGLSAQGTLADGPLVGIEHDADRLTLTRGAGGLHTGGGSGKQLGEQRIFLGQGLVGDQGDFAVAGSRDQGDDATALKEAEDALAGAFDEQLDIFLAGSRRGVEHAAFAVVVGAVDTVEEEGVKVRRKSQVAVGTLDGGHRAGLAIWQAALDVAFAIPLGHRIGEDAQDLPK